ncbi:Casein kinase I isoform delta, partial [Perkinsus chesapeaki]
TEKRCPLDDSEIRAFWFSSLTVDCQEDILKAPRNEVRTFPLMCERSRGFYDSQFKSSSLGKRVNIVQATPSNSGGPTTSPPPAPQPPAPRPASRTLPTTRFPTDPSAARPDDSCSDPALFCLDFLRRFRCQRCLSHAHGTSLCPEVQVAFLHLRCPQCGVHHDRPVSNPSAHCAGVQCHRCGASGHLGRACPCPEPRKRPRTSAEAPPTAGAYAVLNGSSTIPSRLQLLDVLISPCVDGPMTTSCSARGLLDSGCEVALVSAAELERWQRAGVSVSLLPDETTLIPFDGAQRHKVLGRGTVRLSLEDDTSIDLVIRVAPQLSYPLILPLHVLRLAGGAVWIITDDDSGKGDSLFIRPNLRGLWQHVIDPGQDLQKLDLRTCTTDSLDGPFGVNSVGLEASGAPDEEILDDYFDVPRQSDELLPVALVPDRSAPDGRPSVSVPWRSQERPKLNYTQAKARDASVQRRLDPEQRQQYQTCVDSLIDE